MTLSLPPLPYPAFGPPKQSYELDAQDVHIHCLDIRRFTAGHYADAERIMNTAERERAQKFVRGRESYIASRWLLRQTLARYLGIAPKAVEFLRTDKGRPYLPQGDIDFSLSHSGDWALLAVGKEQSIGIDVELIQPTRDLKGIAENYYHPHEIAHLQTLNEADQTDYFYRLWTLKEAFFKATGSGISAGLEKIAFVLDEKRISAEITAGLGQDADEWQFQQWALTAQVYCALASQSEQSLAVSWLDALSAPAFS